jgi:hypothetical protein
MATDAAFFDEGLDILCVGFQCWGAGLLSLGFVFASFIVGFVANAASPE